MANLSKHKFCSYTFINLNGSQNRIGFSYEIFFTETLDANKLSSKVFHNKVAIRTIFYESNE